MLTGQKLLLGKLRGLDLMYSHCCRAARTGLRFSLEPSTGVHLCRHGKQVLEASAIAPEPVQFIGMPIASRVRPFVRQIHSATSLRSRSASCRRLAVPLKR